MEDASHGGRILRQKDSEHEIRVSLFDNKNDFFVLSKVFFVLDITSLFKILMALSIFIKFGLINYYDSPCMNSREKSPSEGLRIRFLCLSKNFLSLSQLYHLRQTYLRVILTIRLYLIYLPYVYLLIL